MAQFRYQGRAQRGQSVQGQLEAANMDAVATRLLGRGITPIKIEQASAGQSFVRRANQFLGADKVRPVELVMFCRQMYTITKSGIPLTRGIRGLAASIRHEHFQEVLNEIADRLETGSNLSAAFRHYPKIFNSLFISMVAVGEVSGNLDTVFQQLGFYIERDEETKKKIKAALRYPSFVLIAIVSAIVLVNIFVIPEFARLFTRFDIELPLVTQILIGFSTAITNYWMYILPLIIATVFAALRFINTPKGALWWGEKRMKLPIVGGLIERALMARYARSFSLMMGAGVPITQVLNLCAAAIDNPYLEQKIKRIREGVERGDSLLRTHSQANLFTPLVIQMVAVGEESGQVEALLTEVAEFYEREVDYDIKTLVERIEPILVVVMAGFVLVLALGIFLPMWGLYDAQLGN